ncbi:indole-3-glycerol phosphate synthase TrpC [Paramaledivibacter caminithermalis]|jgi:indole-3-glycerol phosphate synthase|uniref:Indole-3-glycerol phosphate synthase n=1 Tax=Paramaledivibacter caminithermalis (strain DSM 15212 / CIP 107654 / DViRD3) TaxID=1121301 RepID=A0A1M6RIZ9_PARC5|nr:indole-3-glycerol phosphate synthase TrpC [Paramaledivibacter caminithermalis]SHK32422.1 indole-3-glycerol phosphate synthase [Paramaledivibacter caminithermalis DSM 15212]
MILDKIVTYKKKKVKEEKEITPIKQILPVIQNCEDRRNFKNAFEKKEGLSIIAEIKKASPSKGIIKENFNPLEIAKAYTHNKAEAISVLTEDKFFWGDNSYLNKVRNITSAPLLRKDFIIEPYQIYQSKMLGADAILLIVSILSKNKLIEFQKIARSINLSCLVEVHDRFELEIALESDAEIIGINNRNLKTFETSIDTTKKLIKYIPKSKIVISESGINTRSDMKFLESIGVKGVLIGESFMRANSIKDKFKELRGI